MPAIDADAHNLHGGLLVSVDWFVDTFSLAR